MERCVLCRAARSYPRGVRTLAALVCFLPWCPWDCRPLSLPHRFLRFSALTLQCATCLRSSRALSFFRQKGHGRKTGGRPPDRPATRLCADLIHWSDSTLLQKGHSSEPFDAPCIGGRHFAELGISCEGGSTGTARPLRRRRRGSERRIAAPSSPKSRRRTSLIDTSALAAYHKP